MCKGTRCTHDSDPAVEHLESPYDTWQFKEIALYEEGDFRAGAQPAAYLVRVIGRNTHSVRDGLGAGPGHDQAMIRLKDDLGRYHSFTDEDATESMRCHRCPDHQCFKCDKPLPHMAVGVCLECWWTEEDTEILQAIRGLLE